eukprot:727002_1
MKYHTLSYDGEWGKRNGKGTEYYRNGEKSYIGNWKNGQESGKGKIYRKDGKNGKWSGKGKIYHEDDKLSYDGEFVNGDRHGKGTEYYISGRKSYVGDWKNNLDHGKGTISHDLYYSGGKHWNGSLYYASGQKRYHGDIDKNGIPSGNGKEYRDDGTLSYDGECKWRTERERNRIL